LLNFLSGRLVSDNLTISGSYRINGSAIESLEPYSNQIGYVTQEDALLGTLTPRECFRFAADLRLEGTKFMKYERVEELISELGLTSCADVKIGNTFIKGVSGGERKRTSIGVELITNPNVIFLDEPTTGLDSTTALQVILLLSSLARKGKTIISTIHQPSSELFCEFDRLMLLVDGRCIYSGRAEDSYNHFGKMGYVCPELMNAS
jgi:ABC-type multidrug transport system ATPase subunit